MGFGWGVCLRGAGTTNYLVRAVRIDDEEWGMTEFAQLVAETLDQSLGPHRARAGRGRRGASAPKTSPVSFVND